MSIGPARGLVKKAAAIVNHEVGGLPLPLRVLLRAIFTVIFQSPDKAVRPVVYLAASADFADRSNVYLHMFRDKPMDPKVYDRAEGARLWQASAELWQRLDPRAGAALAVIAVPQTAGATPVADRPAA